MEEEDLEQKLSHDEVVDGAEHVGGRMFGEVVKYLQNLRICFLYYLWSQWTKYLELTHIWYSINTKMDNIC